MTKTRQEVIDELTEDWLDSVREHDSMYDILEEMIRQGNQGLNAHTNQELEEEYNECFQPEELVKIEG